MTMRNFVRRFVIGGWQFARACCLIAGVSIAILVLAEGTVRVVRRVRGSDHQSRRPPGAYTNSEWYPVYEREYNATRDQRWKSYVYWGRVPSFHGHFVNIDSAGHRVTPQPLSPAVPWKRVFLFGGSTMWGTAQRDDHTIAAETARRLQPLAGPGARIEVTNFGETGYVFTQGILNLILQLRSGSRPDAVVFYDGLNDAAATIQDGVAGLPNNEGKRVAEFALGRSIDRTGPPTTFRKDLRTLGTLAVIGLKQLRLTDWLLTLVRHPPLEMISADSAARLTTRMYAENVRLVEALSQAYGFCAIYVWQPSLDATKKRLTPFEARLLQVMEADPFHRRLRQEHLAIPPLLDSTMTSIAPGRFIDAEVLFANDPQEVYVDWLGHTSEASVPIIVDAFWPALRTAVMNSCGATAPNPSKTARTGSN
jgi:hypothetical protein